MKRERDAGIQNEKLESAKLLKEYRDREVTYTDELDRLRKELDECTRALEESSEVQKELVRYRKEVRRLEELNKKRSREVALETKRGEASLTL